jgi:hypothetical protein
VEKVVRGIAEGTAFALSPANRDVMLKIMMTRMSLKDLAAADGAYKSFVSTALRKPYPTMPIPSLKRRRPSARPLGRLAPATA